LKPQRTSFIRENDMEEADVRTFEILRLLDPPEGFKLWHGGPTVNGCLRGVDARQAAWRPGNNRSSIWMLALHIAYWKYAVRRRILGLPQGSFPRKPSNFPAVPEFRTEDSWKKDRQLLKSEDRKLVEAVRQLTPDDLETTLPSGNRTADQLFGIALHDAYHVAQIQLIKRLYSDRE